MPSCDGGAGRGLEYEVCHEQHHLLRAVLSAVPAGIVSVLSAGYSTSGQVAPQARRRVHARRLVFNIGGDMSERPMILVLCTGNSARSQMAEAFLRKYHGEKYDAASAGTEPKPQVHPLAVVVMKEIGIDISRQRPKDLKEFLGKAPVRHVLIVCENANQSCPRTWPGTFSRTFMPFEDPAAAIGSDAEKLAVFRRVRDEISQAMKTWVPNLKEGSR